MYFFGPYRTICKLFAGWRRDIVKTRPLDPTAHIGMESSKLGQKVRSAYLWTFAGTFIKQGLTFGLSMLLARLLNPADYGLIGIVLVVISYLATFQDLGLGDAVIYFNDDDSALPTYFSTTALMGGLLTLATFLAAPWIADFYHQTELIPLIRVLSFSMLINGLRSVSQGLIRKRFLFRQLIVMETVVAIASSLIAVIMAWRGFGVWSLVANLMISSVAQTAAILWVVRPTFTLRLDMEVLGRILRWGLPLTGSVLLWKVYDNADYLIIGRVLGPEALGLYTLAFRLATLVNEKISTIVLRVSFPQFAATLKEQPEKAAAEWFSLTQKVALINFPVLALMSVLSEDLIRILLGEKWLAAVLPMRILCIVGAIKTLSSISSTMIDAIGRTDVLLTINLITAVVLPSAFYVSCVWLGSIGVALAWALLYPFLLLSMSWWAARHVGTTVWAYCQNLSFPVLVALFAALPALPPVLLMPSGWQRLLVGGTLGCGGAVAMLLSKPAVRRQAQELIAKVRSRIPAAN